MMSKFLQVNLNHCKVAQDLLRQYLSEQKVDVALVSEPYSVPSDSSSWLVSSGTQRAAIWLVSEGFVVADIHQDPEFITARLNGVQIFSCYASPNSTRDEFSNLLQRLEDRIRAVEPSVPVILAGDFNARSAAWGDWCQDSRGDDLSSLLDQLGLQILNEGVKPTFIGRGRGSIVDLTAASESIVSRIHGWRVCDEAETSSDHQYISFRLQQRNVREQTNQTADKGWKVDGDFSAEHIEAGLLLAQWTGAPEIFSVSANANQRASAVEAAITMACDLAFKRITPSPSGKPPAHWWNADIARLRKACVSAKRAMTRCRTKLHRRITQVVIGNVTREEEAANAATATYKEARTRLRVAINRSKASCWNDLVRSVDDDPWGKPYKIVAHKLRGPPATSHMAPESVRGITDVLFPHHRPLATRSPIIYEEPPLFSIDEVDKAVKRAQRKNTSPGLDKITGKIVSMVHRVCPSMLLGLFNECIKEGTFPAKWKRARIVLLKKDNKPEGEPSSYRPICLLNVVGKVFESMLVARLDEHIASRGGISHNQFGFRKARSTDDAVQELRNKILTSINYPSEQFCTTISLDIKNAFNSIGWNEVMAALDAFYVPAYLKKVLLSYFEGRTAETTAAERTIEVSVTCGVPQGSVVGPLLWNLTYDRILRLQLPAGAEMLGFADDTMVIVSAKSVAELEAKANTTLQLVFEEISELGLTLSVNKTEAMLFTNKYKYDKPNLRLAGQTLELKSQMKYLGMVVERRLLFKSHLIGAAAKAEKVANSLGRLMPNIGGPKQSRRKLYVAVAQSILLYGSPTWASTMYEAPGNAAIVNKTQRKCLLRSICAYRTVSETAANLLSGTPPADLLAIERREKFLDRRSGRINDLQNHTRTMRIWQQRLDESPSGMWTRRLIPNLEAWCSRKHGCLDFHSTQILSGHGCFGQYLMKIKKEPSSACHHCPAIVDDAAHTAFECPAWNEERIELQNAIGIPVNVNSLVPAMLSCPSKWEAFMRFARRVMTSKEAAERERERLGGPRARNRT